MHHPDVLGSYVTFFNYIFVSCLVGKVLTEGLALLVLFLMGFVGNT